MKKTAVALLLLGFALGFFAGMHYGQVRFGATPEEVIALRQTVRLYAQQYSQVLHQWMTVQHDRDMVLAATVRLQQQNKDLLDSMGGLEQQIALYKRILNPAQPLSGLSIEQFVLHATPKPTHYAYRLLVTWVQSEGRTVSGKISVAVEGMEGGHKTRKNLHIGDDSFRMQYFQSLIGEWELPQDFQPQLITVRLESDSPHAQKIEKQFKWEVAPA